VIFSEFLPVTVFLAKERDPMGSIAIAATTNLGDVVRPRQIEQDSVHQAKQAQVQALNTEGNASKLLAGNVNADQLASAAAALKQVVESASGRKLNFDVHKDTGLVVKVTDAETGEMIRQIPGEEVIRLHERLSQAVNQMTGTILDSSA
jgi:uncharacterized FlaG/YvyC family protein